MTTPTNTASEFRETDATHFRPDPTSASIVIFGASGDLTARKLLPALFDLWNDGYLSDQAPIVGVARREKSDETFRAEIYDIVLQRFYEANHILPHRVKDPSAN